MAKYVAAQARGYSDSAFLQSKARLLLRLDRIEEALRVIRHAAVLDPGNAVLLHVSVLLHLAARRPTEAVRLSTRAIAVGAVALSRVYVKFAFTGQTQEMRAFLDSDRGALDPEYRIHLSFRVLLLERQFHELEVFLASIASRTVRVGISFIGVMLAGLGRRPVAEFRGWLALLLNQGSAAVSAGAQMREFLQHTEQTDPNRWFLRLLEAEAELFAGNYRRAIETARAAVALTPRSLDAVAFIEVAYVAACIFAWSKAEEEAVTLLEELASSIPGLGPGYIARDPLCSFPLANNPRYRTFTLETGGADACL